MVVGPMALPRRRSGRYSRVIALITLLLPLVALLELSGVAHVLADFVEVVVAHRKHVSDCDDEQGGRACDPGCPACHCAHGSPTVVPAARATFESVLPERELERAPAEALRAPSPDRAPPFRPPRRA